MLRNPGFGGRGREGPFPKYDADFRCSGSRYGEGEECGVGQEAWRFTSNLMDMKSGGSEGTL